MYIAIFMYTYIHTCVHTYVWIYIYNNKNLKSKKEVGI